MPRVRFEQAVYGSFPFWDRGYALLAASPGCRPEWLAEFQAVCQRYGEPPPGVPATDALFSMSLPCGVRVVVGVSPQGTDDRGRPGALAFHGLFLTPRDFVRAHSDPFALASELRGHWSPDDTVLPTRRMEVRPDERDDTPTPEAARVAMALRRRQRVVVESSTPIDRTARQVWRLLPARARRRASVTTMAYSLANGFSLAATPSYGNDPGYRLIGQLEGPPRPRRWPWIAAGVLGLAGVLAGSLLLIPSRRRVAIEDRPRPLAHSIRTPRAEGPQAVPPPRPTDSSIVDDNERELVREGLIDLANRFDLPVDPGDDPSSLMSAIATTLRYRGPWLSHDELASLRSEASPEAARALALHDHLRHFAEDRALPADFVQGPLSWQLRVLAWSFRVTPHPNLTPAELPFALADALAMDGPVRLGAREPRYPPLSDYARFLGRLPRR
jgi:hypothetical protein